MINPYTPIAIRGTSGIQPAATVGSPMINENVVKRVNKRLFPTGYFMVNKPSTTIVVGQGIRPKLENNRSLPWNTKPSAK
jgi:hypothetical protein